MIRLLNIIIVMAMLMPLSLYAQAQQGPGDKDMTQWVKDIRDYKHAFIAKELGLSREQQNKFFKVYDAMDDELAQVNSETRRLERRISEMPKEDVTDLEYDMATEALFNLRAKESEIELRYLPELRDVLTKEQLFNLKTVERKFQMNMMRRHHELSGKKGRQK